MRPISYEPIGTIESAFQEARLPEEMRAAPSRLILDSRFGDVATTLQAGQHIWVIYHLHLIKPVTNDPPISLFTKRIAGRPNPIGITLVRIVYVDRTTITVVGLDAVNGTPILDIKLYQAIWDEPPVTPNELSTAQRPIIVLTGGPGGGKSTLIEDLRLNPKWVGRFMALPEAIQYAGCINISPREKIFQRAVVNLQISLEDGLKRTLGPGDQRIILCHRGSLDTLAFWLHLGWSEEEYFEFTGLSRSEHYHRYAAVIHLVTAADGVPCEYTCWPQAHRPEEPDEAIQLDRWLEQAWGDHPHYYRLDNTGRDWQAKSHAARELLESIMGLSWDGKPFHAERG
jgi:tRNA (Thr-GGU) A37 N-methylase